MQFAKKVVLVLLVILAFSLSSAIAFDHGDSFDSMKIKLQAKGSDYPNIDFIGNIEFAYSGMMIFGKYYF